MNAHSPLKLDIEKFRKVYALVSGGATDGERKAAKARAESIAKKAGLTLEQAASKLDVPKTVTKQASNPFEDFFNSPEMRAQRAERERKDAEKRQKVLQEYGSVKAVFDPTPWEIALRTAIEPFSITMSYTCISGIQRHYTAFMDGEQAGIMLKGTERAKTAIASAFPMPMTIRTAMDEIKAWDKQRWDRALFFEYYEQEPEVYVRQRLVEDFIENEPVRCWDDLEARFVWKKYEFERQWIDPTERDDPFMDRIEADFAILRGLYENSGSQSASVQTGRRTNADKRAAVLSMLDASPDLSSREISRRLGVSPQTVSNWRNRVVKNGQGVSE
jgi:transcriptional regulator with XRE-family HTH domain